MTEQQTKNSKILFDIIMKQVKPEEKLLMAGAASRLADSFAEEGFEIVPVAQWMQKESEYFCSNCGIEAHVDVSKSSIKTIRCHCCGARMTNGSY